VIDCVPVSPFIRIRNKIVLVRNQNPVILECEVEAFPEPMVHWERGDGRRLKMSDRYRTEVYDRRDNYKVVSKFAPNHEFLFLRVYTLIMHYFLSSS